MATLAKIAADNYKVNQPVYDSAEGYKAFADNNTFGSLVVPFDLLLNADGISGSSGSDISELSNKGFGAVNKVSSENSDLDKPQLTIDSRFNDQPYITMKSGSFLQMDAVQDMGLTFTLFWVVNNNSARPLFSDDGTAISGQLLSFQIANDLGYYWYGDAGGSHRRVITEDVETILCSTYNNGFFTHYQNGQLLGTAVFNQGIRPLKDIGRRNYEGDWYLADFGIAQRVLTKEELNAVGSAWGTKYGITWNTIT